MQWIHVDSIWSLAGWIHIPCVPRWSPCCPDGATGVQLDSAWTPHGFWTKNWLGYHQKKMSKVHMDSIWNLWGRVKSSQNSLLMSAMSAGVGLPIPVESSAIVPDISRRRGAKAWKQVVHNWEYPNQDRKHFTALKDWKPEWHTLSHQSQLWGQHRMITLEFIIEYIVLFKSQVYALIIHVDMGRMKTHLRKPTWNMRRRLPLSCRQFVPKGKLREKSSCGNVAWPLTRSQATVSTMEKALR